ncbi:hypothetical protein [Spirillospora albida]|uniref:hypothetical protein n=1 Tax=Spirillospora albida TaxID=58123 RepID=UPI0006892AE2|nr:hypothetical protein [Spirillospora albida]
MNIDFNADPTFSWYVVLLIVSGVLMVAGALLPADRLLDRLLYVAFGLAFLGYGIYLGFIFTGGTYQMFFYVFLVPVFAVFKAVSALFGRRGQTS